VTAAVTAHHPVHRASEPHFTPVPPPVPRDPAQPDHRWADRWPLRSYLALGAHDTAPGSARAHVGAVLWEWNLTAISDECRLIVSEMITNAVISTQEHQCPDDPVRLWMLGNPGTAVLFLVWDATRRAPQRRTPDPEAEHGHGLEIVAALSTRWGYYHPDQYPGVWRRSRCPWRPVAASLTVSVAPIRRVRETRGDGRRHRGHEEMAAALPAISWR
jgi:anti-sigma regulatory factor (Ser/Thr protein kinase)